VPEASSQNPSVSSDQAAVAGVVPAASWLTTVRPVAEAACAAHGIELFDVEWANTTHGRVLRVFVVRTHGDPLGGVTIDDCARVSRDISTALDALDPIEERYSLEVSSPGLDRPLIRVDDYHRQVGQLAKLKLVEPASDGQMALRGIIQSVDTDQDAVTMLVDGNVHQVAISNVRDARLVFELGGGKKKGKPNNGKQPRNKRRKKRR